MTPKGGRLNYVTYDAQTEYNSGKKLTEKVWHVSALTVVDDPASPVDTLDFWDNETQDPAGRMASLGSVPTNKTSNRNASTPEPFAIGAHSQNCCGEGETYAGNIAEIIVYSKTLQPAELEGIESYLSAKYFVPESSSVALLGLGFFGLLGATRRRTASC